MGLKKELIVLDLEAESNYDVLLKMGQKFVDVGVAKPTYPQALVDREKNYPTALPAQAFDIATPHTFAEHVNEPAMGIAVLKHPVEWKQMGSPNITLHPQIIFMLAITDPKSQIGILKKIMQLIQDDAKLQAIKNSKTQDEIYNLVKDIFD